MAPASPAAARGASVLLPRAASANYGAGASPSLGEEPGVERGPHEPRAGRHAQLGHHVGAVALDGPHAHDQLLGDLLVRVAQGEQAQHLALALGQLVDRAGRRRGRRERGAERRVDVPLAGRHRADGAHEVLVRRRLRQVAVGAGVEGPAHVLRAGRASTARGRAPPEPAPGSARPRRSRPCPASRCRSPRRRAAAAAATRTASSAVSASPTGSRPSSRSSSSRRPLRSTAWSSTSRMRTGSLTATSRSTTTAVPPPGEDSIRRSPPSSSTRSRIPARPRRSVGADGSKPRPSSSTTRRMRAPARGRDDADALGPAVAHDVGERLLHDPEERDLDALGQLGVEPAQVHVDLDARSPSARARPAPRSRREPALPQGGRPQAGGQLAQRRRRGGHLAAHLGDPLAQRPLGGTSSSRARRCTASAVSAWPGLVVQLAGHPGPLRLLGLDRAPHALAGGRARAPRPPPAGPSPARCSQLGGDRAGVGERHRDLAREGREQPPRVARRTAATPPPPAPRRPRRPPRARRPRPPPPRGAAPARRTPAISGGHAGALQAQGSTPWA